MYSGNGQKNVFNLLKCKRSSLLKCKRDRRIVSDHPIIQTTANSSRKCEEIRLKFGMKVEKIHPDRMASQIWKSSLICKGKRDSDKSCKSAKRRGMIMSCKMQRELVKCKRLRRVKATENQPFLESTKFKANCP